MDGVLTADSPLLSLFLFLLPGFLGLLVYGFLVEGVRQDQFDRVVTAFVLSLLAALCVHFLAGDAVLPAATVTKDTPLGQVLQSQIDRHLLYRAIAASVIAGGAAWVYNHGWLYRLVNSLQISYKYSPDDVWGDVFNKYRGYWVEITFNDGRSLVGWPRYYSATGKARELFIADATWSSFDETGRPVTVDVVGPGVYISGLSDVTEIRVLEGR